MGKISIQTAEPKIDSLGWRLRYAQDTIDKTDKYFLAMLLNEIMILAPRNDGALILSRRIANHNHTRNRG